jgi:hypothetical protein
MSKRGHGEGTIEHRGDNTFRLRYRIKGVRYKKTVHGTKGEARTKLRELLRAGDTGEHVDPSKKSLANGCGNGWMRARLVDAGRKSVSGRLSAMSNC